MRFGERSGRPPDASRKRRHSWPGLPGYRIGDALRPLPSRTELCSTSVRLGDATHVGRYVREPVDAVLCSPPYHGAVDYYRRHQLEMFWLGATRSTADRLHLLQRYVGRVRVAQSHPFVANACLILRSPEGGSSGYAECPRRKPTRSATTSSL